MDKEITNEMVNKALETLNKTQADYKENKTPFNQALLEVTLKEYNELSAKYWDQLSRKPIPREEDYPDNE